MVPYLMCQFDAEGIDALPPQQPPVAEAATDVVPQDAEQEAVIAELNRLQAIERCAEKLWPAVRFFCLAGAHPPYVEAVAELGELLGKTRAGGGEAAPETIARARQDAIASIADAIAGSSEIRGRIGRGACEEISQIVRSMRA